MADPLDANALLAAAEADTGLSDWGDATFRDRFARAVALIRGAQHGPLRASASPRPISTGC